MVAINNATNYQVGGNLLDIFGNIWIFQNTNSSSVNYLGISSDVTGQPVVLTGSGADTNVTLQLRGKGTGGAAVQGTSTNDNAVTGYVGEYIFSQVLGGSATSISNNTITNLTSISLSAGDWDVGGNIFFLPTAASGLSAAISTANNTFPDESLAGQINATSATLSNCGVVAPTQRLTLSTTTTIYLNGFALFPSGSCVQCGYLWARRRR